MIKNTSIWPIPEGAPNIFLLDISKSGKNQPRGWCKISYSIFLNKHTWHSLKSRYSVIHRSSDDSTLYKSSIALQIIQRSINLSTMYKSFAVIKILQRRIISFNVVQIIQRCTTNNSTLYKSFNVVQNFQRSTNHST